jgi:hypothetical protein
MKVKITASDREEPGTESSPEASTHCPACGAKRDLWPHPAGYIKSGETYCCVGCATDIGCTCRG